VSLVEVFGITNVPAVVFHPEVTTLLVEAARAKVIDDAADVAAAEVVDAVAVKVAGRVPEPTPVNTTVVATSEASTFINPTPFTRSEAPKLTAVEAEGAFEEKAPLETDALAMFAPDGVIVNASSPTRVVARPAASLNVSR
jgi:hypothetical protein